MKICFLANHLNLRDGWGSYAVNLIRNLKAQGVHCEVLTAVDCSVGQLDDIAVEPVLPPLFKSRWLKLFYLLINAYKISRLLKNTDLIHVLVEPYAPIAYLMAYGKPQFITLHGTYAVSHFRKWYLKKIYGDIFKKAARLICVSHFTQEQLLKKIQLDNTTVINNGVDYKKFQAVIAKRDRSNTAVIISVGAVVPRKGYHVSLAALAQVRLKIPSVTYIIVGNQKDAGYFQKIQRLIQDYQLEKIIDFKTNVNDEDLLKLYSQADVFLLPAVNTPDEKFEGFGLVYLEANACGLPVIGTFNCGAEDAIQDGYNGLLVPQHDIQATAQAIIKVLSNSVLAQRLGANGRDFASKRQWSEVVKEYQKVYKQR